MGTRSSYPHGQFCWIDLMSTDMQAAGDFYGQLFGWKIERQDTQGGPAYACFTLNGQQVAGLGELNEDMKASGMPPVWSSYINVDDVKATVEQATSLGATPIMPYCQVMTHGHMAVLQDPSGAMVSLWQAGDHIGSQIVNLPDSWVWNELMTRDSDTAIAFYQKLFGWTIDREPNAPNDYWIINNGDAMNAGMMKMPGDIDSGEMKGIPPHWSVYFMVEDIQAAVNSAKSLDAVICRDPFEVSVGHICVVADPQGGVFQLIQLTMPADE